MREARRQLTETAIHLPAEPEETMDEAFFNDTVENRQARLIRQNKLAGRLGRIERRQLEEEEARVNMITLKADEQAALAGDSAARRRYMTIADKMITGMRQAPVMFPVDRVSGVYLLIFRVYPDCCVQTGYQVGSPSKGIQGESTGLAKPGSGCQRYGYPS